MKGNAMIIETNGISMMYKLNAGRFNSLKEYSLALIQGKLHYDEFWALRDVSLQVQCGEIVGVIGNNGAGKSTLLKVLSGILKPTKGNVAVNGNIVPMLELGSGFDHELTGRENIFLNGAILGYSKEFLLSKYDEIVDFSELGIFIDQPLRNYSSGMLMRLAFSVATIVDPEILIVDEILAVGDDRFQRKSKNKMLSMMGGGTTVFFVSHSLDQIRELCGRAIWLEKGEIKMDGDMLEVCDAYACASS